MPVAAIPRLRYWLRRNSREVVVVLGLTAAVLVVFGPVCGYDFINFDDGFYVVANPDVQRGLSAEGIAWAWTSIRAFWHPLTWMSLQLDYELSGLSPTGYHRTNLLLHLTSSLLLFGVLRRTTGSVWRSALAAALFALHPLRVEPVAWVSERKGVLSTFFALLTVAAYVRYVERPGLGRYLVVLLAFILGLMAKPMGVTLPAALLLLDYWPLGRTRWARPALLLPRPPTLRWLIAEKVPLLALALALSWVAVVAEQQVGALGTGAPLSVRCGDALVGYVRYLGKTFWPASLTVFYPRRTLPWSAAQVAGAGMLLGAVSLLALRFARRRPAVAVGWLWYLGTLVPVIGLVQIGSHTLADRYAYLPHVGLAVMLVWGIGDLAARVASPRLLAPAALALLGTLAVGSRHQVHYWQDSGAMWQHTLAVEPDNWLAHNNLATFLLGRGQPDEALPHLQAALAIRPGYPEAHANLGVLSKELGQLAPAREHLLAARELMPENAAVLENLGELWWWEGHRAEAACCFTEAVRLDPSRPRARNLIGLALLAEGRPEEAEGHFAEAVRMLPAMAELHGNLGAARYNQGRIAEAVACLEQAVRIEPKYAAGHEKLGNALQRLGRLEEAAKHYGEALRLNPDSAEAHNGLGTLREAQGRLAEAAACFRRAVQLAPGTVKYHCNLACVLGDLGARDSAAAEYAAATRLDPAWPDAAARVARALATDPDPRQRCPALAVRLARQACQAAAGRPDFQETLAAANAALGPSPHSAGQIPES